MYGNIIVDNGGIVQRFFVNFTFWEENIPELYKKEEEGFHFVLTDHIDSSMMNSESAGKSVFLR